MRRSVRIPLKRDVVTTETVAVGSLAARLIAAESELLASEIQLEQMLDSLYGNGGWSAWEAGGGTLDIYDVLPSDAAVFALHRAGFRAVTQHQHALAKFSTCACRTRKDHLT